MNCYFPRIYLSRPGAELRSRTCCRKDSQASDNWANYSWKSSQWKMSRCWIEMSVEAGKLPEWLSVQPIKNHFKINVGLFCSSAEVRFQSCRPAWEDRAEPIQLLKHLPGKSNQTKTRSSYKVPTTWLLHAARYTLCSARLWGKIWNLSVHLCRNRHYIVDNLIHLNGIICKVWPSNITLLRKEVTTSPPATTRLHYSIDTIRYFIIL